MITLATVGAFLSKFGIPLLEFLKKNWKQLFVGGLILWVVICYMSHCRGYSPFGGGGSDTLSVEIDTVWIQPDTNLIIHLKGFDTIPEVVYVDETPNWGIPATNFEDAKNCKDSLILLRETLFAANYILDQCDSLYRWHTARRVYNDTVSNDSIKLYAETIVKGFRIGEPTIGYTWLRPQPVITKTITLIDTVGPFRKIYVGAGLGPRLPWESDRLDAIVGSVGVGYTDRKNNSYGLRGDFSQKDYSVLFEYKKSFNIGR